MQSCDLMTSRKKAMEKLDGMERMLASRSFSIFLGLFHLGKNSIHISPCIEQFILVYSTVTPGVQMAIEELKKQMSDLKTNTVSKSAFNELKAENDKLKQELESMKANYSRRLKNILEELDEEKKIRLSTQVEMERIRKLVAESHV